MGVAELREEMSPWFAKRFVGFYPPSGWVDYVRDIHEHLVAIAPDYRLFQVKEKFGELRFTIDLETVPRASRNAVHNYIDKKEEESKTICQNCGAEGATVRQQWWIATVCDGCNVPDCPRGYALG